ncbi:MocR-like pyridoxine biosynthesis transcription factor PdxR [Burkholderia pseudomallei]|uniref:MocR-like pyridoxine biosynthesis transcription factor PdxR n=1 Tax=Burkholderia pseudomallei TaxID=28450 RepID=UPI000F06B004|nr:PLP-dependent aminotransferase family protein [Burkholderia pseudomallei]CAJ5393110.1 GntR family transcriptional regulator [Burkholderia pseudomallei]VBI31049.1 GntR family transcriptional regulator [Burkholderia pseudomallei]VBJ74317.1 GntR family transcriptional regulator [Burkholderia pseudomallei]VBO57433.1 GntR family transcriptional regulator [Burkholderia pseudomallei]VBO91790.1 GntR family transcriptional regulator [Burkholderia pseudomallei]
MVETLAGLFDFEMDPQSGVALTRQLRDQLRRAIAAGSLASGRRLPSSRALALHLRVSRNTVCAAIEQLAMEGYLDVSRGRRPVVAPMPSAGLVAIGSDRPVSDGRSGMSQWAQRIDRSDWPFISEGRPTPFAPCVADVRAFPHAIWGRCLRTATRYAVARTSTACNRPGLRRALLHHLVEYRGVNADAHQVFLMPTAQAAIALVARVLLDPGDLAWVESPGYGGARAAFEAAGATVQGIALDQSGMAFETSTDTPRLIFVTPAHQHPTGLLMPPARRQALLRFAARVGARIIEDDYDSEFHYEGRPVAALQGADNADSVFYVGTFSKSLHADIRVGYVVVPGHFVDVFAKAQRHTGQIVGATLQDALAEFIDDGHYAAHIRKTTRLYHARRDYLCDALKAVGNELTVSPPDGGMQVVARLGPLRDDREICRRLAEAGVTARPLSPHYCAQTGAQGLFLGFAAWNECEIDAGVRILARVIREPKPSK